MPFYASAIKSPCGRAGANPVVLNGRMEASLGENDDRGNTFPYSGLEGVILRGRIIALLC